MAGLHLIGYTNFRLAQVAYISHLTEIVYTVHRSRQFWATKIKANDYVYQDKRPFMEVLI